LNGLPLSLFRYFGFFPEIQKLPLLFTKVNQVVKIVQNSFFFFFSFSARVANTACLLHLCTVITSASFFVGGGGVICFCSEKCRKLGEVSNLETVLLRWWGKLRDNLVLSTALVV